jgi:signal transduction histidine kinase
MLHAAYRGDEIMTFSRFLVGMLLLVVATADAAAADTKRILLIHSFAQEFSPWREYAYHIRAELRRQLSGPVEIFEASLATARLADKTLDDVFAQYLGTLSARYNLDLVVTIGAPAANFFLKVREQTFPAVPMIFTGVEKRRVSLSDLTTSDVVVPSMVDHAGIIDHIQRLLPSTDHVAVVIGNSPNEKFWVESISNELKPFTGRVTFTWLNELSFEDMLKRVAALPPRSAILFIYMSVDAAGVSLEGENVVSRLHAVANAPIFSWIDLDFGQGIVGGPLVPLVDVARQVSRVAHRILSGEAPSKIEIQPVGFGIPKYDWRELRRWHISESRLVPGSEVIFRDPSAWQLYRMQILGIAAAILFQTALIAWLIYEHRRRHLAELSARGAMSELTQMNRIAAAGQLSASIAHEINQPLAAISASASAARNWLTAKTPDVDEVLAALGAIVNESHRAGDIVSNLRAMFKKDGQQIEPVDINRVILSVLELVRIELQKPNIQVRTQLDDGLPAVTGNEVQLQQLVLNLIINAKDAMLPTPTHRELLIKSEQIEPGSVQVSIEDSGPGVSPSDAEKIFQPMFTTKTHGMGMGLAICRSIVEAHQGRIWVTAGKRKGSVFRFSLPPGGPEAGRS